MRWIDLSDCKKRGLSKINHKDSYFSIGYFRNSCKFNNHFLSRR